MQATGNGNSGNLNVGGLGLSIGSVVPEARFQCSYPIDVEVTSGSYEVSTAPVTDSSSTPLVGNAPANGLSERVNLAFNNPNGGPMNAGSLVETNISLDFPALPDLTFYLTSCRVQTGSKLKN